MFCENCGSKLASEIKFCRNCGKEVSAENIESQFKDIAIDKTVGALKSGSLFSNDNQQNDFLVRAFIGEKKAEYYIGKWKKGQQTWNWAAFFLSVFWLGYRKMFKPLFIAFSLFLVCDLIIALFGIEDEYISSGIGISFSATLGILGNYLYQRHANTQIEVMKKMYVTPHTLNEAIKQKGGGSWKAVFGAFGLFIGYMILAAIIFTVVPPIFNSPQLEEVKATATDTSPTEKSREVIEAEVTKFLYLNIEALENEDQTEYMSMIDNENNNPFYIETKKLVEELFFQYDLTYELENIEFLSVADQEVEVRVTQITRLIDGPAFNDNASVLIHTLKLHSDGDWKFLKSELESSESLAYVEPSDNTEQVSVKNALTINAPDLFDFELIEDIDVNNDGVFEKVTFKGAPSAEEVYVNENIELLIEFETGEEIAKTLLADGPPTLYFYDINQDGWMEIFFESGYRYMLAEIYQFTSEGLEYMLTIDGEIEEFLEDEVTTSTDVYSYEWIMDYSSSLENSEMSTVDESYTETEETAEEVEEIEKVEVEETNEQVESMEEDTSLLLGMHLDEFIDTFASEYQKNLETVGSDASIDYSEYVEGEETFGWNLAEDVVLYGSFNAQRQLNWVGVRSFHSNPKEIEEAAAIGLIIQSAKSSIISALGDGNKSEELFQSMIDQQYVEFKDRGEFVSGNVKYVDRPGEEESLFMAMNKEDFLE